MYLYIPASPNDFRADVEVDAIGLNTGLFKEITQAIIQNKREHQQAYSL